MPVQVTNSARRSAGGDSVSVAGLRGASAPVAAAGAAQHAGRSPNFASARAPLGIPLVEGKNDGEQQVQLRLRTVPLIRHARGTFNAQNIFWLATLTRS